MEMLTRDAGLSDTPSVIMSMITASHIGRFDYEQRHRWRAPSVVVSSRPV